MNGRVYDYNLERFLSVDPFIQGFGDSQGINPYSYIMNNPLAGTDPSGYSACSDMLSKRRCEEPDFDSVIGEASSSSDGGAFSRVKATDNGDESSASTKPATEASETQTPEEIKSQGIEQKASASNPTGDFDSRPNVDTSNSLYKVQDSKLIDAHSFTKASYVDAKDIRDESKKDFICKSTCDTFAQTASYSFGAIAFEVGNLYAYDPDTELVYHFGYGGGGFGLGFGGAHTLEYGKLSQTSIEDFQGHGLAVSGFVADGFKGVSGQIYGTSKFNDSGTVGIAGGAAQGLGGGLSGIYTNTSLISVAPIGKSPEAIREVFQSE